MVNTKPDKIPLYEKNSREEEAELSLKHTRVTTGVAVLLIVIFLLTISTYAVVQNAADISAARALQQGDTVDRKIFQFYDVFKLLPTTSRAPADSHGFWRWWGSLATVKEITAFEKGLDENSVINSRLRPVTQSFLTSRLGAGNEQAYIGKDGWLFYRPEVEYLTNAPFLDPAFLRTRQRGADAVQPDPLPAIISFQRQLAERGITLLVLPVPSKVMLYPDHLSRRFSPLSPALQNPSYPAFVAALRDHGIPVCDLTATFAAARDDFSTAEYLKTDTHWTPETMELAARTVADEITTRGWVAPVADAGYSRAMAQITALGDIADMFKLPANQRIFPSETIITHPVLQADGTPWRAQAQADVLLLGDSYSNIYSLEGMRWGEHAGFAEQLSYAMQRPVDVIARNAGGSYASREALRTALLRGDDRLAGKRVVIYEFAMRDLTMGDWKLLDLPAVPKQTTPTPPPSEPAEVPAEVPTEVPATPSEPLLPVPQPVPIAPVKTLPSTPVVSTPVPVPVPPTPTPVPDDTLRITATVASIAAAPNPATAPYKDCVLGAHLTNIVVKSGKLTDTEIYLFLWGMRDKRLTRAATLKAGDKITVTLTPWQAVEARYGGYNRIELDDDDVLVLPIYWGELQ